MEGWFPVRTRRQEKVCAGRYRVFGVGMLWALVALLLAAGTAAAVLSDAPREDTWVTNGTVNAIVSTGTTTYIGGNFTQVGPHTGQGVPIDTATGAPVAVYPKVRGTVYVCVPDGAGGWYIGGSFTRVGTAMRNDIAHILSDGTVDPVWNPNTGGTRTVRALAVSGTTVYAGGTFSTIGGQTRNHIAALDATTGMATAWNPNANSDVTALAVSGTTVYAGGAFSTIGGQTRNYIAALDAATGLATAWSPNASSFVQALVVQGATVYAGGSFTSIGGQTRNYIAALDATTGLATTWNPNAGGTNPYVYALAVSGTIVYVGGQFTSIGGPTRNGIAALDAMTGLATAWNPNAGGTTPYIYALALSGTTVYAGGQFTSIGGQTRNYIAALDATTGLATAWNPNAGSTVRALAVSGTTVYTGGGFTIIGGRTRNYIAALDATTGQATVWQPYANGQVNALAVSGTTVYAAGNFTNIGGQTRNRIAALSTAGTGSATTWNPNASSNVVALALSGTTVYAGGNFTNIGGQPRKYIAALDTTTGLATTWNPNASVGVTALALSGTTMYVGGNFTSIGGQPRRCIAALDSTTGLATTWNPNASSDVVALALSGTAVYAGGAFSTIGGQTRRGLAALDSTTGLATAWNPNVSGGFPSATVNALVVSGAKVFVGGLYTILGVPRGCIVALDATTGLATAWNPGANNGVSALMLSGTTMYAGGAFTAVGGSERPHFAEFRDVTAVPAAPGNPGATAIGTNTITWTWSDNSGDESGFKVYDDPGAGPPATLQSTMPAGITAFTHAGLTANTQYAFQVAATNIVGDSAKTTSITVRTLAAVPVAPTVGNPTGSTLDVAIGAGDGNPADTEYAIYCTTTGQWVQPDGTLGAVIAWQTASAWGTVKVSGLTEYTGYAFAVTARNGDAVLTVAGPSAPGMTLDVTPPTGTITINGGAAHTTDGCLTLTLTYDDGAGSGVSGMRFSEDNAVWSGWEPVAGSTTYCLLPVDGAKTVYVQYRDAAGNVSTAVISDDITLDTTGPAGTVIINGGAAHTNSAGVMLTLTCDDGTGAGAADMRFSNDYVIWSGWEPVVGSRAWTLLPGEGLQTVYVEYRDALGNVSGPFLYDDIMLDTVPPTGTIAVAGDRRATRLSDTSVSLTWSDGDGSGVCRMRFSNDGAAWTPWQELKYTPPYSLPPGDGYKTVRVQYLDRANNPSTVYSDSVLLDTTGPTGGILINNNALTTTTRNVTLHLTWVDAGCGVSRMRFSDDGTNWTVWEPLVDPRPYTLPEGLGYHTVRVQYTDATNNYSAVYSDYIKLIAP